MTTTVSDVTSILKDILRLFDAQYYDGEYRCACPVCQPQEMDVTQFRMKVAHGDNKLFVIYCYGCCRLNDYNTYRAWLPKVSQLSGCFTKFDLGNINRSAIRKAWAELDVVVSDRASGAVADQDLIDEVYGYVLSQLELTAKHAQWLDKRGLNSEWAFHAGYRTSSSERAKTIVEECHQRWGDKLAQVPGFVVSDKENKLLLRDAAILTPCRDYYGRVLALKHRMLDGKHGRMRMLSASLGTGVKALNFCHTPLGVGSTKWKELWITEGERKADVHWTFRNQPTIGIPGIGNWRTAIPIVKELTDDGASIIVALDCDGNEKTQRASSDLCKCLHQLGYRVTNATWTGAKGLDDASVANKEITLSVYSGKPTGFRVDFPSAPLSSSPLPPRHKGSKSGYLNSDDDIIKWLHDKGPVLRDALPARSPDVTRLIKDGRVLMKFTPKGQLLGVPVTSAGNNSG